MIYFDNAATTRPDGEAFARAQQFYSENYFNPSAKYGGGFSVRRELERGRETILSTIADPRAFSLVFTSGGTEGDNQAVFCGAKRGNAVTTLGEHSAVYKSFVELKNRGIEPRFAKIGRDGRADEEALLSLVDEKTSLVSVVHVNNETGAVNDVARLARLVKQKNPRCLFHSDGVQAYGKIPFRLTKEIDLYTVSAHKIGGLKGTGALFKRKDLALSPYLFGGGQENELRSGTENVLGILDFAYVAEKRFRRVTENAERAAVLREKLASRLLESGLFERISPADGSPYLLSVSAPKVRGEVVQRMLSDRGLIAGTGSACSSKQPYSRIIEACGYREELLNGVLRLSFSPETTSEEIERGAELLIETVNEFRKKV